LVVEGNVGIGTATPEDELHIARAGGAGDTDPVTLRINNTTNQSSSQIVFEEDNQGDNFIIRYYSNSGAPSVNQLQFTSFANSPWMVIDRDNGNVGIGTLSGGGDVYSNASGYLYNSSDQRLKKNIKTISNQIDVIESLKQLRGVYFNWNTDIANEVKGLDFDDQRQMGMIAQEVEKVIPEVVGTDNEGYKTLSYSRLVGFLIEVNKVQQEQIEELKIKIEALEK